MARTTHHGLRTPRTRARLWRSTGRILGRLVHGLLAATVLAALLIGLPWALMHFVGWPLPDHLPSWAEAQGVLLNPMTTTFLLNCLACLTWLVWVLFAYDVVRCATAIARDAKMPDLSAAGPMHRTAAVLVGAVLISILGHRAGPLATSASAAGGAAAGVVAIASARIAPSAPDGFDVVKPAVYNAPHRGKTGVVVQPGRTKSAVVLAYDPGTGVHDSLWRMSKRTLGDGNRWPEIYELNKGKPRLTGGTFIRPGLVFPGEEMVLPDDAVVGPTSPAAPAPAPAPPEPPRGSTSTPAPTTPQAPPATQARPATETPSRTDTSSESGFRGGEELFVGLGLAAAVSAALVVARRRNRHRYQPGSGNRSDLPLAPVVYQLRLAHLREDTTSTDNEVDFGRLGRRPPHAPALPLAQGIHDRAAHGPDGPPDGEASVVPVGVQDGREIAVDLAATHGLGLLGAGAPAAVRALLVAVLSAAFTTAHRAATVIVPAEDLPTLFGKHVARAPLPAGVRVAAGLTAALDMLESETSVRIGQLPPDGRSWARVVLVARAPGRPAARLQAVLDNGSTVGVTGLLLGQWHAGVTAYVREDGTVSATSPGLGEPLHGARVFRLGDDHLADLLDLLRHADPVDGPGLAGDEAHPASKPRAHVVMENSGPVTVEPADRGVTTDENGLEILGRLPVSATQSGLRLRRAQPSCPDAAQRVGEGHRDGRTSGNEPPADVERHETPEVLPSPLRVSVLGPPRVWWRPGPVRLPGEAEEGVEREITSAFQPRLRELLVFLALHPDGVSREALVAALWATSPPERTTNAMNTSLSRLRRALAVATSGAVSDLVVVGEGRYQLDPDLAEVDYHQLAAAVAARRAAVTDADRVQAYRRIVDCYTGPLADGLSTEWIETAREAIRRDAIDAVAALARALVEDDPQQTLDLLEIARAFDPHNELIYRDIMRLQERLGQLDAIPRTLTLLTTRLAEVDDLPTRQAVDLADRLRRRHDAAGEPSPVGRRRSRAG